MISVITCLNFCFIKYIYICIYFQKYVKILLQTKINMVIELIWLLSLIIYFLPAFNPFFLQSVLCSSTTQNSTFGSGFWLPTGIHWRCGSIRIVIYDSAPSSLPWMISMSKCKRLMPSINACDLMFHMLGCG